MSDKRSACRVRRRLPVTFSDGRPHRGITANLSRTGACIHSDYVVAPGTELELTLGLPGISDVHMQAVVEWAKKLRGSETLSAGHSMGLRYLTAPGPEYHDFMALIEGLAQPHGLTTRQAESGGPAPASPRRPQTLGEVLEARGLRAFAPEAPAREPPRPAPPSTTPPPSRRVWNLDPRREPETRPHTPRRVARDPRREPDATPGRPRRDVEVVPLQPPILEAPRQQQEAASRSRPEKNLDFVVAESDLAAAGDYPCSLSTARVAWLLEQGAAELIAPRLKGRMATVGLSLEVSVPPAPLAVGTPLEVVVALVAIGSDRRTFGFELQIREGERLVATGRHVRQAVEPAS